MCLSACTTCCRVGLECWLRGRTQGAELCGRNDPLQISNGLRRQRMRLASALGGHAATRQHRVGNCSTGVDSYWGSHRKEQDGEGVPEHSGRPPLCVSAKRGKRRLLSGLPPHITRVHQTAPHCIGRIAPRRSRMSLRVSAAAFEKRTSSATGESSQRLM